MPHGRSKKRVGETWMCGIPHIFSITYLRLPGLHKGNGRVRDGGLHEKFTDIDSKGSQIRHNSPGH